MDFLLGTHIKNRRFDHGYLLIGDFEAARREAREAARVLLGCQKESLESHPDFSHRKFDLFGIKESHELKSKSLMTPFSGGKKVFIVELFSLTAESANALLKLFEEPPEGTHFFVIAPSADAVMPTLRSRLTIIDFKKEGSENAVCGEFLTASPKKRMDIIKKIGKDKNAAIEFLNGLEAATVKTLEGTPPERARALAEKTEALDEIGRAREFLSARAPSVKMVLERLALVLQ